MYKSKFTHPYDMDRTSQLYFDDVELVLNPELYYAIRIYNDSRKIYVGDVEIKLPPRLFDDFRYIATETIKNKGTHTYLLEKNRRNFRTKSKLTPNAIYKNICEIKRIFKRTLKSDDPIIIHNNGIYHINIDLSKKYNLLIA